MGTRPSGNYTAIPYRASTGPEQGFPCVVFPYRENPVFIAGFPVDENRFFPVWKTSQGKPCSGPVVALYRIAVHIEVAMTTAAVLNNPKDFSPRSL